MYIFIIYMEYSLTFSSLQFKKDNISYKFVSLGGSVAFEGGAGMVLQVGW